MQSRKVLIDSCKYWYRGALNRTIVATCLSLSLESFRNRFVRKWPEITSFQIVPNEFETWYCFKEYERELINVSMDLKSTQKIGYI